MKLDLKKTLIIVGVALALVGTIVGVIVAIPSGNDNTTTTTTTTTTTKKPGESTTTTTTTTTKPKEDEPDPHEHVEEVIPGKAATCTETGLTDGTKCSVCGETLTAQAEIPKTAHTESDWIVDVDATEEKAGSKHTECTVCHEKLSTATIPKLEPKTSEGLAFKLNSDGKGYSVDGMGTCLDSEIIIPAKYNNLPVTGINDVAFSGYAFITSVTIPDSVTSIDRSAFSDCTSLTSITIPDSVTEIGGLAFSGCTSLTSITIPDSVTSIGEDAFDGCTSLTSVTIPDSVTNIGSYAFRGCTSLTSVTIPDSVTSIGNSAFRGCTSLTEIHYNGTKEQWNAISKGSNWNYNTGKYTIYCTDGNISK